MGVRRLLAVLSCLELSQPTPSSLELEYLSPVMVQQAMEERQTVNEHGVQQCDVRQLHAALMAELNANPTANTGHRKLITQVYLIASDSSFNFYSEAGILSCGLDQLIMSTRCCP